MFAATRGGQFSQASRSLSARQIENHRRRAGPVDDLGLHFLQPDLGGLGLQYLVRHPGERVDLRSGKGFGFHVRFLQALVMWAECPRVMTA